MPAADLAVLTVFIALCLFRAWFKLQSVESDFFENILPSRATFNRIDIGARVQLFYTSALFLLIAFFSAQSVLKLLFTFFQLTDRAYKNLFTVPSVIGIICLVCELFSIKTERTIIFILVLIAVLIVSNQLLKKILYGISISLKIIFILSISISLSFFISHVLRLLFHEEIIPVHWLFAIIWGIVISIINQFRKKAISTSPILFSFLPISFLGIGVVVSQEFFLILNQHQINFLSATSYLIVGSILLVALSVFIFYKKISFNIQASSIISKIVAPVILVTIIVGGNYLTISTTTNDFFELANPANGLMRIFQYHEIPFFHFMNSHGLSELFAPVIYTLLNGFSNTNAFTTYGYLPFIVEVLIIYFLLLKIFKSSWVAFLMVLLFPFLQTDFMCRSLIFLGSVFFLHRLFIKFTVARLVVLGYWLVFNLLWILDSGIANFISVTIILIIYLAARFNFQLLKKYLLAIFLVVVPICFTVIIITIAFQFNTIENIQQAWFYISASQAHGDTWLSYSFDRLYYFHYYIIPVVILFVLIFFIGQFKYHMSRSGNFMYLAIVFFALYYLANFQRGLVRHTLVTGYDDFFASFLFLLLPLTVYFIIRNKQNALLFFFALNALMIFSFKIPVDSNSKSLYNSFTTQIKKNEIINASTVKIVRTNDHDLYLKNNFQDLITYMEKNLSGNQTFIDFATIPMLYFYTNRRVPSYFNQYLQNTITDELQKINLSQLTAAEAPIVVCCHEPEQWGDNIDGVPNNLRYERIWNFIFENYHPATVLNDFQVWVKNDFVLKFNPVAHDSSVFTKAKSCNLIWYPMLLALNKTEEINKAEVLKTVENQNYLTIENELNKTANYLEVTLKNNHSVPTEVSLLYFENETQKGSFKFSVARNNSELSNYLIPVSIQYNWRILPLSIVKMIMPDHVEIHSIRLLKIKSTVNENQ